MTGQFGVQWIGDRERMLGGVIYDVAWRGGITMQFGRLGFVYGAADYPKIKDGPSDHFTTATWQHHAGSLVLNSVAPN